MRLAGPAALALALAACSGDPPAPRDKEAGGNAIECACGTDDDCDACLRRIGECCYQDATIGGQVGALASACGSDPACQVCCGECARLSCDELVRSQSCPPINPE